MKKKKSKDTSKENPNQLSFEFQHKESHIDVHIPKTNLSDFSSRVIEGKRMGIRLAES